MLGLGCGPQEKRLTSSDGDEPPGVRGKCERCPHSQAIFLVLESSIKTLLVTYRLLGGFLFVCQEFLLVCLALHRFARNRAASDERAGRIGCCGLIGAVTL